MRSQHNELDRYYDRLTPKERAILSLKGWKNDEEPDEVLKRTTPAHDVRMVRSYLQAIKETEMMVGGLTAWLEEKLEGIQGRLGMVYAMQFWEAQAAHLRLLVQWHLPEVMTESEAAEQVAETRRQMFTLNECGRHLADAELDEPELGRDVKRQEKRVRAAMRAGELKGTRGKVRYGDLADWSGEEVSAMGERGLPVVLPDSVAGYVAGTREAREKLTGLLGNGPGEERDQLATLRENVLRSIACTLGESEVARVSLEEIVAWASEDFDGEETISPILRGQLDRAKERIGELVGEMGKQGWEVELPVGCDAEFVETLKGAIAAGS